MPAFFACCTRDDHYATFAAACSAHIMLSQQYLTIHDPAELMIPDRGGNEDAQNNKTKDQHSLSEG